jgi:hypothetical protein
MIPDEKGQTIYSGNEGAASPLKTPQPTPPSHSMHHAPPRPPSPPNTHPPPTPPPPTKGNTSLWDPDLRAYLDELKAGPKPYSYRYVGALVGDFHRTLSYGGIWKVEGLLGGAMRSAVVGTAAAERCGCGATAALKPAPPPSQQPPNATST